MNLRALRLFPLLPATLFLAVLFAAAAPARADSPVAALSTLAGKRFVVVTESGRITVAVEQPDPDDAPILRARAFLPGKVGTPIRALAHGTISAATPNGSDGNLMVIDHGDGVETRYAHLNRYILLPGTRVRKGQIIAHMGTTGRTVTTGLGLTIVMPASIGNAVMLLHDDIQQGAVGRSARVGAGPVLEPCVGAIRLFDHGVAGNCADQTVYMFARADGDLEIRAARDIAGGLFYTRLLAASTAAPDAEARSRRAYLAARSANPSPEAQRLFEAVDRDPVAMLAPSSAALQARD